MVNYLAITMKLRNKYEVFFEVMRDMRKGGITPENYDDFIDTIKKLPEVWKRTPADYEVFKKFDLKDITENDQQVIMREVQKRGINSNKKCWHPEAGTNTCSINASGNIVVSAAHSIQNNGVLSKISEDGHVMGYVLDKAGFEGQKIGKNGASIFFGFCNNHDSIFKSIENEPYQQTVEQNFLFAYRGFVVSSHKKEEAAYWMDYGEQSEKDIAQEKRIFDDAIQKEDYDILFTEVFELPAFYPIAVSTAFYLDFDFKENPIPHSDERMENIYVTLLPNENRTYFIVSFLKEDEPLYRGIVNQLKERNNLKLDISILLAAHTENIYFAPSYFTSIIERYKYDINTVFNQTQFDYISMDESGEKHITSLTPSDYLSNYLNINLFGY